MYELLILLVLLDNKCTIYEIRQRIQREFSLFLNVSFGTLHPALKRLEENNSVSVKRKVSAGGQRSSVYSITESGKEHFNLLMNEDLPDNPALASQLINIKLMALSKIDEDSANRLKKSLISYLELQKVNAEKMMNELDENNIRKNFIGYKIRTLSEEINMISSII